jgi:hypothetical protein
MREERTITPVGRFPVQHLWWSAIFGGTFFALGIMLILSFFGVAVGAAASAGGITAGAKLWAGIWSLVTTFLGFLGGGWMAARASGSVSKRDGLLHGLVVWGLGSVALFYFAVTSTTRIASILADLGVARSFSTAPGTIGSATVTAAVWTLITAVCGLVGAMIGGRTGGYDYVEAETTVKEEEAPKIRRAA